MSATYPSSIINARLQVVVSAIDAAGGNGSIVLYDAASILLSTIALARPAGTVALGVLTFSGVPLIDPAASATGFAASAKVKDSNGNEVVSGLTVGGAGVLGVDVVLSNGLGNTLITAGQTVALTVATVTGH